MSKTPRYTDLHRWPHGYRRSDATDIRETFERARREQGAQRAALAEKVKPLKKVAR